MKSSRRKKVLSFIALGLVLIFASFFIKKCVDKPGKTTFAEVLQEDIQHADFQSNDSNKLSEEEPNRTQNQSRYGQTARKENEGSFIFRALKWFWRNAVFFILIVGFGYLLITVNNLRNNNKQLISELKYLKQKLDFTPSYSDLQGRYFEKSKFDDLVTDLKKYFQEKQNINQTGLGNNRPLNDPTNPPDPALPIFFPAPNSEGYFHSSLGSKHLESGMHIFSFEYSVAKAWQAKYKVVDDQDSMRYAINYTNTILIQACEIENLMFQNPSRIENITQGEVIKEGENWKIVKKAIIRYG